MALLAARLVDVRHAGRESIVPDRDFARHRVGEQREPPGRECRGDENVRAGEVRLDLTSAIALAAVVTRLPAWLRGGEDREARWDAGNLEIVRRLLHEQLVAARLRRREEFAVRLVVDAFLAAEHSDEVVDPVVERREILIADRPVVAESIARLAAEVFGAEAERDAPPVVGAATEHAAA